MFQYAFYLVIRERAKSVFFDTYALDQGNPRKLGLVDAFGIGFEKFRYSRIIESPLRLGAWFRQKIGESSKLHSLPDFLNRFSGKARSYYLKTFNTITDGQFVDLGRIDLSKRLYFNGYWQSSIYFSSFGKEIRAAFRFRNPCVPKMECLSESIAGTNSVSIHFRRGDYQANPTYKGIYGGICTEGYYMKAIEYIEAHVDTPRYFIFSDDAAWVKELPMIKQLGVWEIASGTGNSSWHDMFLMSRCKHNIIANSTFSWWAAWLNEYPEKTIVCPDRWVNKGTLDGVCDVDHIIEKGWIRL